MKLFYRMASDVFIATAPFAVSVARLLLRLRRCLRLAGPSALILPPTSPGSRGDEAMVASLVAELKRRGVHRVGICRYQQQDIWPNTTGCQEGPVLTDYFSDGYRRDLVQQRRGPLDFGNRDFFADNYRREMARFSFELATHDTFYLIGADVLDGKYSATDSVKQIELAIWAGRCGVPTRVVSCSFNESPSELTVAALRRLPSTAVLCARDPVSKSRFDDRLARPAMLVGDLAILLQPDFSSENIRGVTDWIAERRSNGGMLLGINVNSLTAEESRLVDSHAEAIATLCSRNPELSILLLSHDIRPFARDEELAKRLFQKLSPALSDRIRRAPSDLQASEIKAICRSLDLVLSGRMHLAIASLSVGTPACCICYQAKFEGLFQHFALGDVMLSGGEALEPEKIVELVEHNVSRLAELRDKIASTLPRVKSLAQLNIA